MATESPSTVNWQDDDLDDDNFEIHNSTRLYIVILFSIIVFITFIFFLYTRYVTRSRSRSSSSSVHRTSPPSCQPQGLEAAIINSLPITVYHQDATETALECSICLGGIEEGEKVKVLPSCCHCYHCECVDKWLITHSSCPVCRTSVRVDSPV